MQEKKVYAKREGTIYTVYMDTVTREPMQITAHDDVPNGAESITYTSKGELQACYPQHEIVEFAKPRPKENVVVKSRKVQEEAAKVLNQMRKEQDLPPVEPEIKPPPTTPDVGYRPNTASTVVEVPSLVQDDGRHLHAQEFLKRLEVAYEYASQKNKRELQIKIDVIKELINEVFQA